MKYSIEVEYKVVEQLFVEADDIDQAEDKALELVRLGVTDRNTVSDTCDRAEINSSKLA